MSLRNVLLCVLVLVCIIWRGLCETTRICLGNCTCSTYSFPGVASTQNLWPSMLKASLLSEVYPVPLKNPTTLDSLVNSILSTSPESQPDGRQPKRHSRQNLSKQKKYFSSVGVRPRVALLPGEVYANCYEKGYASIDSIYPIMEEDVDISAVVKLDLSNNQLTEIRHGDLTSFSAVKYLFLNNNSISAIEADSLPESIVHLSLQSNKISAIPETLKWLKNLKILDLANNQLMTLTPHAISDLPNLALLSLHNNNLIDLSAESLIDLPSLQILDLAENQLAQIPETVRQCTGLRQLLMGDNKIGYIAEHDLQGLVNLQWIDLQKNNILDVDVNAFASLPALLKLILDSTRNLKRVPSLNGTHSLDSLRIGRADLSKVPSNLCENAPVIRSLYLPLNHIQELPDLSHCSNMRLLGFSNNEIRSLRHQAFIGTPLLHDLHLQYNLIEHIPEDAFVGLTNLQVLNMEFNRISSIEPKAFLPLLSLEDINLGNNQFPVLPSIGLEHVVHLKVHNNRHLRQFPGPESFPAVHSLVLSYAYHCCPFISLHGTETYDPSTEIQERVVFTVEQLHEFDPEIWNQSHVWPHMEGIPTSEFANVWANSADATAANALNGVGGSPWVSDSSSSSAEFFKVPNKNRTQFLKTNGSLSFGMQHPYTVQCIPQPGPFMPCRDLFDWWTLRCGVWIVFLLSLMGNGIVVVVLISAFAKMDVPRFLVTNLAFADFFMGIYLGILAVVDASTLGDFRMYAIPWQLSIGCQVAGFLGVLSSELSVYTLAVITMERNYAITHAMHLNKRLSLKHASYIMAIGWLFSLTMALLPLTGVSDYRKFAICLPFETDGAGMAYVVFLMVINGVAFLILMCCYLKIYCAIRGSQAWNSNDSRIAKRMALLVFTDFICWAPIAFFSLSAVFGLQLLSLDQAKIITVFVLPLNSCCNPFLYALLTKQFKKDCVILCKAIEESRVTRGIGRCRHSSNFSNRQTPANTNSALDQNSKDEHHSCSCRQKDSKSLRGALGSTVIQYLCCHSQPSRSSSSKPNQRSPMKVVRSTTMASEKGDWNWRGPTASTLRLLELRHQNTMDLARKSSQESSLSSSRNDSSGTSGSTMTWRISRSSVSSDTSSCGVKGQRSGSTHDKSRDDVEAVASKHHSMSVASRLGLHGFMKPRLERQRAIDKDPTATQIANQLRCPLHSRGDNLSCVYEQASLEEEDCSDVFTSEPPVCVTHKRSLSDGILCGTLLSLSAPTPQLIPTIKPKLPISRSLQIKYDEEACTVHPLLEKDDATSKSSHDGVLETHFPVEAAATEIDPLLRRKSR